jgi:uncharacterized membrane protein YedE/YeeE
MIRILFILLGSVFGFLMSRAGATQFDFYAQLFLFQDLQLLWVILAAVSTGMLGVLLFKRFKVKAVVDGARLSFEGKPRKPGLIIGALLFGIGWGVTGMCPGSAAVMLGEGKVITLAAGFGMLFGTWLYALMYERRLKRQSLQTHSC